jgi:deoxyribodipyrimidine photo-lyase
LNAAQDLFAGDPAVTAYPPTLAAAQARIAAVQPGAYARTRNALNGAATGLSPYITHGFVSLGDVLQQVDARTPLDVQHKLVFELGWREFFRHVWQHRGSGILQSLHQGVLPDAAYAQALPLDIAMGTTGVPAIDQAVAQLLATGTLHNHARMWLASYVVHVRKVHWRVGADWLVAHLLDGDLASNHLSWQWVAGTGSHKPYLFNAENVARYAPAAFHSAGSVVDVSYEALDTLARTRPAQQARWVAPGRTQPNAISGCTFAPPEHQGATAPNPADVAGADVWLVHPWSLGPLPAHLPPTTRVVGLWLADFHQAWPWHAHRWQFVGQRMAQITPLQWHGTASQVQAALAGAQSVGTVAQPHLHPWLDELATCHAAPQLFAHVPTLCTSFSQWWTRATRGLRTAADVLASQPRPGW